ncbi:S66 family peptidase [Hamadaea tsunoensis]|uniref:S66 family peptidase n=1 Tax=Hamadaea tsunoensis TaxID=53368 RepID=UPI0004261E3E|nr:S66 peptidase family protein [Hamadaea tsunoensis]
MLQAAYPAKPQPGDKVAILSPSWAGPGAFPEVYALGLHRLRHELGLEPVEYPTTLVQGTPAERARDIHAAFADPEIKAVFASIGGADQITVLPHLDGDLLAANPKPFFGYSDNTNLLHYLWRRGIVGYHGGAVLVHLARGGRTHPDTMASLRAALFRPGWFDLSAPLAFSEQHGEWTDPATLTTEPPVRPAPGRWDWHNPDRVIEGTIWGGNLEIVTWLLMADKEVPTADELAGQVLVLETSEDMPSAADVGYWLVAMGERGLLSAPAALLVGRPKAWDRNHQLELPERDAYAALQRAAILRAMAVYNPAATIVFDVDFGHTDPQLVLPYGGRVRVDGPARTISVHY